MIKKITVYHSIIGNATTSLIKLNDILASGAIKSAKALGEKKVPGFNLPEEICLGYETNTKVDGCCSYFETYFRSNLTLIMDINASTVYYPEVITLDKLHLDNNKQGLYTRFYDEVRTTKEIPIQKIVEIGIPSSVLLSDKIMFLSFADDAIMKAINNEIDDSEIMYLYNTSKIPSSYEDRKRFIADYIEKIQLLLDKYNLDIPISESTLDDGPILRKIKL